MKIKKLVSIIIAVVLMLSVGAAAYALPDPDEEGAIPQEPGQEIVVTEPEEPEPSEEPAEPSPPAEPTPTPTATPEPSLITKHPLGENVKTGDTIVFTAYADNTTNVSWFIIGTDGSETYAGGLSSTYPGVTVSGENSNKLVINNATVKLNGCSAYARFVTADGTFLKTDAAKITVTQAAPTPTPSPKPSATPKPLPTPTPSANPVPTVKPLPVETEAGNTEDTAPAEKDSDRKSDGSDSEYRRYERKSHAGAVVFLVLIGLVLAATAAILILYVKGIINLDWLEKKLNGNSEETGSSPDDEDDDEI